MVRIAKVRRDDRRHRIEAAISRMDRAITFEKIIVTPSEPVVTEAAGSCVHRHPAAVGNVEKLPRQSASEKGRLWPCLRRIGQKKEEWWV